MNFYERNITIRIVVEDDEKLTNAELDKAFERITQIISAEIDENSIYMDAVQESVVNAEVTAVVIPHSK